MIWTREKPSEPGYYWFVPDYRDEYAPRFNFRRVDADSVGKLYVSNIDSGDWGPDARYMAVAHRGWWQRIPLPPMPPEPPKEVYEGAA